MRWNGYLRLFLLSDVCNFSCKYCLLHYMHERQNINLDSHKMDLDVALSSIKSASKNGLKKLSYFADGEPLLYPNIMNLIWKVKEIKENVGFQQVMTTNGSLLDRFSPLIGEADPNFRIILSIDSLNKEKLEYVREGANYEKIIQEARNASELKLLYELDCVLSRGINDSEEEIESILDFGKNLDVKRVEFIEILPTPQTQKFSKRHYIPIEKIRRLFDKYELRNQSAYKYVFDYEGIEIELRKCFYGCGTDTKCSCKLDGPLRVTAEGRFLVCPFETNHNNFHISKKRNEDENTAIFREALRHFYGD